MMATARKLLAGTVRRKYGAALSVLSDGLVAPGDSNGMWDAPVTNVAPDAAALHPGPTIMLTPRPPKASLDRWIADETPCIASPLESLREYNIVVFGRR